MWLNLFINQLLIIVSFHSLSIDVRELLVNEHVA